MNDIDYDKLSSMVADKVSSQIAEKLIQKTTKLTLSRPEVEVRIGFAPGSSAAREVMKDPKFRYLEAIQTCTLLLSSLFDEAERGDSFTTRATPEVLSETVWFNDFQPT